jgi:hypothetical protein
MISRKILTVFTALLWATSSMLPVHSATVTVSGTDLDFTYDNATMFGTATVVGNALVFFPTNFKAASSNGTPAAVAVADTLNVGVEVRATSPGFEMTQFFLSESGDYRLDGIDASASAEGQLQVTSLTKLDLGFTPFTDAKLFDAGPLTVHDALTQWSASTDIDLGDTAGWFTDTKINLQLQNDLLATTLNNGESAFVQKKIGAIGVSVNAPPPPLPGVPVPPALFLFGSGLLGLVGMARRKKA